MKKQKKKVTAKKSSGIKSLFLSAENNLTNEEKIAVRVLNFIAEFDGVITNEYERWYLLNQGMKRFIRKKRQHLVRITKTKYTIRIVAEK